MNIDTCDGGDDPPPMSPFKERLVAAHPSAGGVLPAPPTALSGLPQLQSCLVQGHAFPK